MSCVLCPLFCIYFVFAVAVTTWAADAGTDPVALCFANPDSPTQNKDEVIKAFQAAETLQLEGKTQEALSAYEAILREYPDTELKSDIMIKVARCHSWLGDDDSAIQTYLGIISDNPDTIEASQAVSLMMNLYSQRYRFDEVIAMSRQLAHQFPGTEVAAMALYRGAGYLYMQGEFQKAIQEYESFIEGFPKSIMRTTAFNRLVSLYIREGMFEEAEHKLMEKLSERPEDSYVLRQLALVYQKKGEYERALDLYQQILASSPDDVDIYERLGTLYAEKGDKEKAIAEWSKITLSAPGQYSRHQMLAHILKSHGFYDQAAEEYRKAIELKPEVYYLYNQLADVYVVKKDFDSAIEVYLDALMMLSPNHPNRPGTIASMLELCDLEGLQDKVISRLREDLNRSPGNMSPFASQTPTPPPETRIPTFLTLADFYFHQGRFSDSLKQFRIIASLHPDDGQLLFDHAQILERERRFSHAVGFYQAILDLFPDSDVSSRALLSLGQLKARLRQPQAAIADLRELISMSIGSEAGNDEDSLRLSAYALVGDIYLQQMHDVQMALSTYTEAKRKMLPFASQTPTPPPETRMSPFASQPPPPPKTMLDQSGYRGGGSIQLSELDLRIAECYRLMERYDAAESVLDSMQIGHQSRSVAARIAKVRADCHFSMGDFDSALTQYQEAIQWLMNEDWVNDALDRIALIKEYSDLGMKSLLEVLSQTERLRKLGQYDRALELCVPVIEEHGVNSPFDRIQLEAGDLLALQMKAMEAISAYENLLQSDSPMAPYAQFRIARVYWEQLSNAKQAMTAYSMLIENYPESILVADARKQIRRLAAESSIEDNLP